MGNVAPWLTVIVAVAALELSLHTAWRQRVVQEQSYLILSLTLQRIDAHLIASTSLENWSLKAKSLDTVFLLIGALRGDANLYHQRNPVSPRASRGRRYLGIWRCD